MSESYTTGGDTLQSVDNPNWQGQTFRVSEDHILQFIDLEMRGFMTFNQPVIQIFHAEPTGFPMGDCLSRDRYIVERKSGTFTTGRVRFSMQPYLLTADSYYVIIVSNFPPIGGNLASWQYDEGDATYPRGIRISSNNSGATWSQHADDDFMFVEWGDPPLPKPEPPPPIDHFTPLAITQAPTDTGILIKLSTSVPCHLTLYWTDKQPRRHKTTRIERGLEVPWGAYFCFVAWQLIEQIEPGDTLYHTFHATPWDFCQTRWVTIKGNIDDIPSPSVGPIFKKHYGFLIFEYLRVPYSAYWGSTGPNSRAAQTFTTQEPQTIAAIRLPLRRSGTPGTITISIRATDPTGHPTGSDLTSGTTDGNTLPSTHPGEWRFFTLTPLPLNEYVKYAIVIKSQFASILWPHVGGNQYPFGQLLTYTVETDTWNPTTRDFIFECWGTPA